MNASTMLVTDLDGTLLGDGAALERFNAWRGGEGTRWIIVYATGRSSSDVARLVARGELPRPTFTVGALGTELYEHSSGGLAAVGPRFGSERWDPLQVQRLLHGFATLELQPDEYQSQYKVSYFLEGAERSHLDSIDAALSQSRLKYELVYSGERFLDVLPRGVNKGATTRMLATRLGIPPLEVIACGDSGNDISLFQQGFRGVLVGNAEAALLQTVSSDVYRSAFDYADGVLDGVRYWSDVRGNELVASAEPLPNQIYS